MSKTTQIQSVTLHFDLLDLPTAQHKAGLAGLLLQIEDMERRKFKPEEIPCIIESSGTSASIELTERSVRVLIDDLYNARIAEAASGSKWAGAKPKRIDEKEIVDPETQKKKTVKKFIYDIIQPDSLLMRRLFNDPDNNGPWLKLWRDMLWNVPRSRPAARRPFNQRAQEEPTSEATSAWKELLAYEKAKKKGDIRTTRISGTQWLGAQGVNAEGVDFVDRSDHAFLLHFWMLTIRVFVPAVIGNDGKSEFVGYSLAIPEVSDLEEFCDAYPQSLGTLANETRGYRPRDAVIDIPAEAALQFMLHLSRLVAVKNDTDETMIDSISNVEYLHLVKAGNNTKMMAAGRVSPNPHLLGDYDTILQGGYRNPLFRSGLISALLNHVPWHTGFDQLLIDRPWPLFIRSEKTPRGLASFGADVRRYFNNLHDVHRELIRDYAMTTTNENQAAPVAPLELLIHRLVRKYVQRKTELKSGMKWDDFKDKKIKDETTGKERVNVPKPYSEAKSKVASDVYLAMRSRREQEFADYFTASICSVGQFLREEEFQIVAKALLENPATIKTLSLLALSANS